MTPDDYRSSCTFFLHDQESNKFLLQLRDDKPGIPYPNTWTFPGGDKDGSETPRETARRELREEIHIQPEHLEEVITLYHHSNKVAEHYYYVPVSGLETNDFTEGKSWQLFGLSEIEKLKLGWWSREVLPILRRFTTELEHKTEETL